MTAVLLRTAATCVHTSASQASAEEESSETEDRYEVLSRASCERLGVRYRFDRGWVTDRNFWREVLNMVDSPGFGARSPDLKSPQGHKAPAQEEQTWGKDG